MKQPFTAYYRLLLLALALGTGFTSLGQTYTPVALTGFTHDVIANGTGAVSATTTADIDGAAATGGTGYTLMAQDYVGPAGQVPNTTTYPAATYPALETSGLITSTLNSAITFQLASYSANNALRLYGAGASGTLSFATPSPAAELYVIGTSGNAASVLDLTVTFTDGTTQLFPSQTIADWFAASQPNVVREKLGRVSRGDNSVQYTGTPIGPRFYQLKLVLDAANVTKNIAGITFTKPLAAGNTVLLAVTAGTYPVCATTPSGLAAAATTAAGGTTALTTACSSTNIYLSLPALANQSGYTFQWQSSTDNVTFTNISGATSSTYTATNQLVSTYYRAVVTCLFGGTAANSASVQVLQSPVTSCYCVPVHSSTSTSYTTVTSVSLPGDAGTLTNAPGLLTSTSPGYVSAYYAIYPASTTTTTLSINGSYTLSVAVPAFARASVWIDYDQNGTFDASEFTLLRTTTAATSPLYSSSATTLVATITPPVGTLSGPTRMRVRTDYYNNTVINTYTGACATTVYGEALDYTVSIAPPVACTGTPPATAATSTATSVCTNSTAGFILGLTGITPGTTGLTYQWQSSPAGANTFTNLGTAQAMPSYTVATQTASTDYRVVVTCTASSQSTTSSLISVATSFLNCYCTVTSTGTNEYIKSVTFPGTPGFTNATNANSTGGYGDFTTTATATTTLTQGTTYVNGVSVIVRANNVGSQGGMWIDYDHSGTFDASEYILLGTSSAIATDITLPVTLVVPTTALLGQTRVRVRWRNGSFANTDACVTGTTTWYGETEDYFVTIAAPTTCSAPPATVVATADVTNACSNSSFTLSTNSIPLTLGGYTYQWQSRTGTNAFADIVGATTNPYTIASQTVATDYRLVVGCQYGGTAVNSNTVSVGQNTFDQCYCTASSTNVCSNYGVITSVNLGTINNPSGCTSTDSYSSYASAPTPTTTTTLTPGTTATLTLGVASATTTFNYNYGVWIDFNHNGTFDAAEFVAGSTTPVSATTATISLAIPAVSSSVLLGPTRMRIRTNAGIASYGIFTAGGACGAVYNGETEDYLVTLAPCTPTTATFSYGTTTSYCVSGTASPAVVLATGATAGTYTSTTGLTINATTGTITLSTSTPGTYTVTNTVPTTTTQCGSTATTTVTITAAPTASFSYPSATICAGSSSTLTATPATGATAGTFSLPTATGLAVNATTGVVTVGATAVAGTYTVTNTVAATGGCAAVTATATFTIAPLATATFSYTGSPYCVSGTANPTPTVTGTAGGTFSSTTGLTINASTGAITLASSTPGTYVVTYAVSGTCGASSTQSITINAAPTASFAYPTPALGAACAGGTGTFAPSIGVGATAGTFSSTTGLAINATTGVISLATSTAGTYTITNTVTGNCAPVTSTSTFTVNPIPATPTITVSGTPATGITLTSSSPTGNQFYLGGVLVPGATGQSYLINSGTRNGIYTVVVTSAAGCSSTASAPTTVTVTASRSAQAGTTLELYPNPTRDGQLTLALSGYHETVTLSVVNALGQRVFEGTVSGNALNQKQTLNLGALPAGMYLLQARTASGSVEVRRIVRE
ncbi:beta strand repeat-containing protein [Hymenobacter rubidus]|uniref:beta strand repeat-containing protein n=1 Tax=Hymenobacter rubidus TaxID=1441626 RepID=UPI00191ED743|nr:GEVED domain-containing protein [Hymenobacter rubidus]